MRIAIGADHKGFELKSRLKEFIVSKGIEVLDCGTYSGESTDYPDYAFRVSEIVSRGEALYGILICFSGIGMSIAANKVKGIRAALCLDEKMAELARRHNNANILCLSGGFTDIDTAIKIVEKFIYTGFDGDKVEGERHKRRLEKIERYERSKGVCDI